ncbi:catalase [Corynebacterium lizhenjunii]|uniref:catalase n=1 Tax=Corynebacterium lizhenjunii TaxID=2709394 RepID=UPI0013EACA88|nr:catalase [Corynebacterium lizhenjunii]
MTDSAADKILNHGQRPAPESRTTPTTRPSGQPVASENTSMTAGPQGANVLNDLHLIEKLAHFNRERVPERNPHAKGHGAFGELHITEDVSQYTKAKVFQKGTVTPMVARFSTVAGEQGSPDTWRDVHGFALRFYTEDGNYDIVGNNTPTFFLRDGIKFPDFIHSQKRLGANGLRDADMQWDFWTRNPETAHQVTYLMGDRGTPKTSRHQDGFGSHTFQWINEEGTPVWIKYHFKTRQGWDCFTDAEATEMAGLNADFQREDLYNAIEAGDYPIWDVKVQIMPFEDAENYRFNPFDLTKTWSQKDYPLVDVGYFVLNRNPRNFFAQIEQLALDPGNLVPGVGLSPDRMLQARAFAYADQHRYRIGANYKQLPVNQPLNQVNTYEHEGSMQFLFNGPEEPVYSPNRHAKGTGYLDDTEVNVREEAHQAADLYVNPDPHGTDLTRAPYVQHPEDGDFVQAGILYREVMDDDEKERLANNIAGAMAGVSEPTEQRVYEYWDQVDERLGQRVREVFAASK